MKGVILAGGTGSRLYPLTRVTNKHLLPIYDKPMIYYPIQKLIEAGIKEILIVSGGENISDFLKLLGSGREFGVNFTYRVQDGSGGIPVALYLAKEFVGNEKFIAILGDNIMDKSIKNSMQEFANGKKGAKIFLQKVHDPKRFGLAEVKDGKLVGFYEKPENPVTDLAIAGIYMFDHKVFDMIRTLKPSKRGELEILEVLKIYAENNDIEYEMLDGFWIDAGTFGSLYAATKYAHEKSVKQEDSSQHL